jgi:mRNA interferase MazF
VGPVIRQGELYRVSFPRRGGSAPAGRRPAVILQSDAINGTAISTVVVAAITTNLKYRLLPTSVTVARREAGLPEDSLVNLTLVRTIEKSQLGEKIGCLPDARLREVLEALRVLFDLP